MVCSSVENITIVADHFAVKNIEIGIEFPPFYWGIIYVKFKPDALFVVEVDRCKKHYGSHHGVAVNNSGYGVAIGASDELKWGFVVVIINRRVNGYFIESVHYTKINSIGQ